MPKITSLSEQLKRLQVPQTNILSSVADRKRVSFLYDPKEAANLDSEAVYSIAMNGLEQLKSIDRETFESFELTLFNSTSITFERGIQTKQVNEKLNTEIRRFLLHLSPYFMLKPAHKAFEWLVYRYQIHTYNIDDMFMCILPYHETNYFVRALQMLDFERNQFVDVQLWSWLIENQKQGVQLASSTLATRIFSDLSLLNYLIDYLNESVRLFGDEDSQVQSEQQQKHWLNSLNFVFSFLTKTLLQSIKNLAVQSLETSQILSKKNHNNKQQEAFFALLLPVLFNGFKSEFIPYKQTSYLLISFLFEKFKFNNETTNKALFAISKGLSLFRESQTGAQNDPELYDCVKSAILSICLIVQSQYDENLNGQNELMSKNFLKKLLKNFSTPEQVSLLLSTVDELNQNYRIDKFLKCFHLRLISEFLDFDTESSNSSKINIDLDANDEQQELRQNDSNQFFDLALKLINLLNLNRMPSLIDSIIGCLFSKLLLTNDLYGEFHLCELIYKLECKYPIQFDSCLNKFLQADNLDKNDKNKFLTIISCKFSSLKCKSTFKYQQAESDLSLLLSLNHQNANVRANGLGYILTILKTDSKRFNLDQEFIKSQLEAKFRNDSSPSVYEQILKFSTKLLDYFGVEQLIEEEFFLPRLFTIDVFAKRVDLEDGTDEMREYKQSQNTEWQACREAALDLVFNDLFHLNPHKIELFFNTFIRFATRIFDLGSSGLYEKMKTTNFFKKIHSESCISITPIKKSFYSSINSSSISISKINGNHENEDEALDEMFESFLQVCVKYMLSNENKLNNTIVKEPKCFAKLAEQLRLQENHPEKLNLNLLDLVVFEVCIRICAQSMFLTNSAYYLNLAVDILTNLTGSNSAYNLKLKKSKPTEMPNEIDLKKLNSLANYSQITLKKSIKNPLVLLNQFTNLFKSISIQVSNFTNKNVKNETEDILNKIYVHLCAQATENSYFSLIMKRFIHSNSFANNQTPSHTPTKQSVVNSSSTHSFYQFIFKFLLYSEEFEAKPNSFYFDAQIQTIYLYSQNLDEFLASSKKTEHVLLNSVLLVLTWCLTSPNYLTRLKALNLLEQINEKCEQENLEWKNYLKKLLKHRKEIEVDGTDYVRSKSLNKIFSSEDSSTILLILTQFFELSLAKQKQNLKPLQYNQFMSIHDSDLDSGCSILVKFKLCLLDLFKNAKDELKLKFQEVLFNQMLSNLNESSNLLEEEIKTDLVLLNKLILNLISSNFLVTKKSAEFFNQNEKYFDYLIGYLRNQSQAKSALFIRQLKTSLSEKLANENSKLKFFQQLEAKKQAEFLKCFFDMWIYNSSNSFEETLNTSEAIQENIKYLDSIKQALLAFDLNSSHFICLLNDKVNLTIVNIKTEENGANTTREMKKQLAAQVESPKKAVDWRALKLTLELVQASLVKKESEMETDQESSEQNDFIDIIPYLFLVLETIETKFSIDSKEDLEHDFLYFEIMCLNSLLSIYKLNKLSNKSKLDQSKFNIELLMQILQTKRDSEENEQVDRLNVQQHILILLSEIASIFPEKVLEHVLIMFVFVGNKLARKDDSYSFQIINQIIKSILPSIVDSVNSSSSKQNELTETTSGSNRLVKTVNVMKRHEKQLPYVSSLVCKILQSFVVALPHIPAHRKTIIFDQLMSIIGLDDNLWITIIQSIDHYLVQSHDLLDFTQNLEEVTNKQQQLLSNNTIQESSVSKNEKKLRDTIKSCNQAMIALHVQFEPGKIIQSSIYLIAFLNKYFTSLFEQSVKILNDQAKSNENRKQIYSHLACQLDNYNLLQMKYLAYNLLTFVSDLLVSEELVSKLASLYDKKKLQPDSEQSSLFENLLEKILILILKLSQVFGHFEQQVKPDANQTLVADIKKFHKAILNKSYDLLERTINLLDTKQFLNVIKTLIKHDLFQIRRRALVLLNNKLRKNEPSDQEVTLLISMIDDLLGSIQLGHTKSTDVSSMDIEINNQTILFSIKLLCKRIGEQNPLAFVKVIKYLSENLIDKKLYIKSARKSDEQVHESLSNSNLLSSVLLCIGEVCLKLKTNALTYLNQIMSFTLEIVDFVRARIGDTESSVDLDLIMDYDRLIGQGNAEAKENSSIFKNYELLALSCVTCMLKVVQNMANFLSPYLKRLFYVSCSLSYLVSTESEDKQVHIELKLTQLRSTLAKQIPLRLLAPILSEQSALLVGEQKESNDVRMRIKHVEFYMQIARLAIQNSNQEDLIANIKTLRLMFMNLFDLRANYIKMNKSLTSSKKGSSKKKQISLEGFLTKEIGKYEDHVINAFCELTFKLSEDLFKPIFFKMYEWSTSNNPSKDRLITFYRSTYKLSEKLKNLFVLFAPQFVQNAADVLNQLNSSKTDEKFFGSSSANEKENILLYSVVDTLSNVFLNDTQRTFLNKERFNVLMEPLVDQIENEIEYDSYNDYISKHLGPCIANLASCCVNEDALLRKFNYQILLKTKHSSVQVRLATLDVLNMFSKKVGDIYNSYLAETVPFLAELMEDPVEEVEDKVQYLIKELEDMLGESLQSHFV